MMLPRKLIIPLAALVDANHFHSYAPLSVLEDPDMSAAAAIQKFQGSGLGKANGAKAVASGSLVSITNPAYAIIDHLK